MKTTPKNYEVEEGSYADDDLHDECVHGYDNNILCVGETVECVKTNCVTLSPNTQYQIKTVNQLTGKVAVIDDLGLYAWTDATDFKLC